MCRIDQRVSLCVGVETTKQVILSSRVQVEPWFVQKKDTILKRTLAIVHEMHIKGEEPLETLRLFLEWDHPYVFARLFDLRKKGLTIYTKLHFVLILTPASSNLLGKRRRSILQV